MNRGPPLSLRGFEFMSETEWRLRNFVLFNKIRRGKDLFLNMRTIRALPHRLIGAFIFSPLRSYKVSGAFNSKFLSDIDGDTEDMGSNK